MNDICFTDFVQLFSQYGHEGTIWETGSLENDGRFHINYSSILTRLIQEAGRYCEHWASDLFIDWSALDRELEEGTLESKSILFGFRDCGVDHTEYILSHCQSEGSYAHWYYRSVWRLDIEVTDREYYSDKKLKMTLYRVSIPSSWTLQEYFEKEKTAA